MTPIPITPDILRRVRTGIARFDAHLDKNWREKITADVDVLTPNNCFACQATGITDYTKAFSVIKLKVSGDDATACGLSTQASPGDIELYRAEGEALKKAFLFELGWRRAPAN